MPRGSAEPAGPSPRGSMTAARAITVAPGGLFPGRGLGHVRRMSAAAFPFVNSLPTRAPLWPAALALLALMLAGLPAMADGHRRLAAPQGVAVGGYDPVAYFTDGRAEPGAPEIALRWRGVRWHFASPAHRSAFEANPKAYLPQFGGFCALSVALGSPVPASPEHFVLIDGRLYLAEGAAALTRLLDAPQDMLQAARANWPPRAMAGN